MKTQKPAATPAQAVEIALSRVVPDPDQPRKNFDPTSLNALAESIEKQGIQVPLLVRAGKGAKYIIHDGERRWRAAKLAKLKTLPVLLVNGDLSDEDLRVGQLAVNNLREQLKPMEIARLLADLQRKHFASVNDVAAHFERHGLPAMTPKQIHEAIALVDLPDWAQDMIDQGQIEASAAVRLKIAMPYPKVLKEAHEYVVERASWSGRATAGDVGNALRRAFQEHAVDLDRTRDWDHDPVLFNPKTACKGCEHLVSFDSSKFCMNSAEYERKNAEAREAGLLPGGKRPEKPQQSTAKAQEQEAEKKAEARNRTLGDKARDYLHAYLVQRLVRFMQGVGTKPGQQIDVTDELLAWHAMKRPGEHHYGGRAAVAPYEAATEAGIKSLDELLAADSDGLEAAKLHSAIEQAHALRWREVQVLCHHLWSSNIEKVWIMDEAFTQLFRKAELLHLVAAHELAPPAERPWEKLKASELKQEILARAEQIRRPKILQDIYQTLEEPYVPWSQRNEEDLRDFEDDADHEGMDD